MPKVQSDIGLIAQSIKAGFDLWKTFIATRQEAYNRKADKKKNTAIDAGERFMLADDKLAYLTNEKDIKAIKKLKVHWRKVFIKNNG